MHQFLIEGLPEAILQLDSSGHIRYCNRAALQLTGYSQGDMLGKPIHILMQDPDDKIRNTYQLNSALSHGKITFQGWNRKYDGELYWAETILAALYQDDGQPAGFGCIVRDVSEQKYNEKLLRDNEERFRLLVEGVQEYAIYMLDIDGNIITWNEGGQKLTGYISSEIIGKHFSTFYTANDLINEKPKVELDTAIRTGKYEEEGWRIKKNGAVFWASIVLTAVYNIDNKLIGFSKVIKDLTEQNTEETALRQSEERYRLLVDQVTDYAIFMLDEKGRIVSWNEGAKRIKGYEREEIIGKYFSIFYPQEDIFDGKPSYELKVARRDGKYEEEGWRIRKDGTRLWANVVITAVYDANGALRGFSKVTRDLTERKKAEEAEKEISDKYRQMALELETINEELSRTNTDLEQFTSIVAHDLKEPLRTVKSFLHLTSERISKGQVDGIEGFVSKSLLAADRMKELIENVLNYSQVSKGHLQTGPLLLDDLVDHVKENLKGSLDRSGAEILFDRNENINIVADKVQLVQLLQNLISNAIKFTDGKKPVIHLKHQQKEEYAIFSISDNGIGIDVDSSAKIFDPFRRLHAARNYPGVGMGLAICKRVVERHNGRIWVESKPGEGSTFHFTLWEQR
ncbi:PAS domain S-box protein [Dyadobacter psychrophilus]|uniref:histidine kinase n=1 Tax=Dyadobacter psychrophilus TaxID=651661 RepID=A0A1T5HK57_9BACT|nr:PAS domain S-box protein [Dyadobacter psychrophilus]SKC20921.1 PAS domain S-box-containing protein [Dyadobacter psychrophilus]